MIMETGILSVKGLLDRLIPKHASQFELDIIPQNNGKDVFEIDRGSGGSVLLRGSNGISLACALNEYLKYECGCHLSWSGDQLTLPERLPHVRETVRRVTPYKYRYMYNFCTFNYSMTWWDWDRWEREIDWLALHGINMPLAMTGQEAVWMSAAEKLGLTDEEMLRHLTGPAYLAWHHMGNVDGMGGPLPQSWIDGQAELQRRILQREREYGMTPVLCGFYGHVPAAIAEKRPEARITQLNPWFGMPGVYFLDPRDPLFMEVAAVFYEEQTRLYGTDHLYAMDLFHEGSTPDKSISYLTEVAQCVCDGMRTHDPQGVWVMQSWSMNEHIVRTLPDEHLLLLDLYAEQSPQWKSSNAFFGKPWVWCMLRNFGGRNGMFGNLDRTAKDVALALCDPEKGRMEGIGFAPEAIEENPVFYDLLSEMVWRSEAPDTEQWVNKYIARRYGCSHAGASAAWQMLLKSVYNGLNLSGSVDSVIQARPNLSIDKTCNGSVVPFYDVRIAAKAWELLLGCSEELGNSATYRYDLVDIGREVMAAVARPIYMGMVEAFHARDQEAFSSFRTMLETLIADLDELVGTNEHFLTGRWISAAEAWAANEEERVLYRFNARTLISTWWPEPLTFDDYSHRQWSGMLIGYYLERWKQFNDRLSHALDSQESIDEDAFERDICKWEIEWMNGDNEFATSPSGDTLEASRRMFVKYEPLADQY